MVGAKLTLSGSGLRKGGTIAKDSITFGGKASKNAQIIIGTDGAWIAVGVVVPNPTGNLTGSVEVKLIDSGGRIARGAFHIIQRSVTIIPDRAPAGSAISIGGSGFRRNSTVNIQEPVGTIRFCR